MKNRFKLSSLFVFTTLLTLFSCSNDDDDAATNEISLQNLEVTIDENPTNGQVLGTVVATQTVGGATLNYAIDSQIPVGALAINSSTGELTVADATLFDYETNSSTTAIISVNGATNSSTITVNLNNINEIGDFNHGGVVFWIDPTDSSKGLVCAVNDQSTSIVWGDLNAPEVTGTSTNIGSGVSNTDLIIASKGSGTTHAAGVARAYNAGGYTDWSLPSNDELIEIYNNKTIINATATANSGEIFQEGETLGARYWVSNMSGVNGNFLFDFYNGFVNGVWPVNARNVRAVRAWTDN
jgi:hypothetical protein